MYVASPSLGQLSSLSGQSWVSLSGAQAGRRMLETRSRVELRLSLKKEVDTWSKVDVTCVKSHRLLLCGACPQTLASLATTAGAPQAQNLSILGPATCTLGLIIYSSLPSEIVLKSKPGRCSNRNPKADFSSAASTYTCFWNLKTIL